MTTIQILHASDLEGGLDAIGNAPNFAAVVDALEQEAAAGGYASFLLSAGDNFIPGPFFNAAQFIGDDVFVDVYSSLFAGDLAANPEVLVEVGDGRGQADIAIMNIIGFDASAIGNHEFDNGADAFFGLITPGVDGNTIESFGALFPYLSTNLSFPGDGDLATTDILPGSAFQLLPSELVAQAGGGARIAQATILGEGDARIGVVGATTQRVEQISSTGEVTETTTGDDDMPALAAAIQPVVDALTADGVDKIVLSTHLQDINLEQELAALLRGVDVIIAGGSDTILANADDVLRAGDEAEDGYPLLVNGADGTPTAIVSTDGEYSYVGRLVVEFDDAGVLLPDSIADATSGPVATDAAGVLAATGAASLEAAIAGSERAVLVETLTDAVETQVTESDGNVFGQSDVFLDGRRETVRVQEANFGNLTADANILAVRAIDPTVTLSIKNGGGIRAAIGEVDGVTGELLPTQANPLSGKEEGEVSALDVQNALRFDNTLSLITLSTADLKIIMEHAVAASGSGSTPGQFPQIGGFAVSVDLDGTAQELDDAGNVAVEGSRIQSIALIDQTGAVTRTLVADGEVVSGAPTELRVVTLGFLLGDEGETTGGDGYPFRALGTDVVDTDIGEQAALQQFLAAEFPVGGDVAFDAAELPASLDSRIQLTGDRTDTVDAPVKRSGLDLDLLVAFQGDSDPENDDSPEGASEVVVHADGRLYVTNGNLDRIDIFDIAAGAQDGSIDLASLPGYDGVQSVAVGGGLIAAAVDVAPVEDGDDVIPSNGLLALYDIATLDLVDTVETGVLPDNVVWSGAAQRFLVANEGEFNTESDLTVDAPGSLTSVLIADGAVAEAVTVGFDADLIGGAEGLRLSPDADPVNDIEPEYIAVTPDGATAYVTLQENNTVAVFDVATSTFTGLQTMGLQDFSAVPVDVTDDEVIDIETRPVDGLRMADAIQTFVTGGETYYLTANEGDGRGDAFEFDDDDAFVGPIANGDEARGSELAAAGVLDEAAFPTTLAAEGLALEEAQEVGDAPVPDGTAAGSFDAVLDEAAGTITVSGSFSGLSAPLAPVGGADGFGNPESAIHVHLGDAGSNGPIFFNTTVSAAADMSSGSFTGTAEVTAEQIAAFRDGGYYVNLHTEAFPGGELRGQIELPDTTTFNDVAEGALSRLIYSAVDGDTDGDGDIDQLTTFGGRSFTIYTADGEVVFDSGSDFEEILANLAPERFLDDDGGLGQNRADAKGVEPEAIEIGRVGQQTYAFIGLERDSGIMVYNISDPGDARFETYIDGFVTENIAPEVIEFISAEDSTTGNAQIAVSYEVSGTTAVYDIDRRAADETTEAYYTVSFGRNTDLDGFDFWADIIDFGSTERLVADEFADSDEFVALYGGLDGDAVLDVLFGNAVGREASDAEQDFYADEIAENGFGQVIFDLVNGADTVA